ncbi:amino acid transport system, permease protein (HisMQ-family protein) [Desulforapulum autotrophicum HRM2]|uniref:Amino acid transport system, permease protein (HisMQ-family protein) n=1 Tax=Desulforapulum autotrophicum (strain ATCC 43914 / DSM 3382 / VKM B-1955 / HRM2) TaxID=177437 RepID=C0QGI0_DESAH|nr:amino acid ABC transporter permease [Desulforapulum autotrophicum]ACN13455.1 amino acid transport system, permease protein (HisMQ-family protein) [Desulforapulum autotrophicum HRM2]
MLESLIVIKDALPFLIRGSLTTGAIVLGAMFIGLVLGLTMACGMVYGRKWVRRVVGFYVWFFQGVPVLVLLFLFYFGLFNFMGLTFPAVVAVTLVLGMTTAAYQANIFRGAMLSIPSGQFKAANALGMSNVQAIVYIVLPQVLRISIPAWSNEFSIILKDSALAFVIGAPEIMARTQFVASRTYQHLPLYITAGLLYFVLTWSGVKGLRALENKVRIPGYSHQGN